MTYSCTCDNHTTHHPASFPPHNDQCRRHMHATPVKQAAGNGLGGRGDDDPQLMARFAA